MGTYHHGNLRASLIETGVELARASGPDGVVLREVARRTGVSHNAAYRHFADRGALLAEVAELAMVRLGMAMDDELRTVDAVDPAARAEARLRATGRAYVAFALEETGLFEVAFSTHQAAPGEPAKDPADAGPFSLLNEVLDEGLAAGVVSPERRPGAEVVCWSAVHGFATLHVRGPLNDEPEAERQASLEQMLDHLVRGLS